MSATHECRFEVHPEYRRVMRCVGCGVLRSARCECDPAPAREYRYDAPRERTPIPANGWEPWTGRAR